MERETWPKRIELGGGYLQFSKELTIEDIWEIKGLKRYRNAIGELIDPVYKLEPGPQPMYKLVLERVDA